MRIHVHRQNRERHDGGRPARFPGMVLLLLVPGAVWTAGCGTTGTDKQASNAIRETVDLLKEVYHRREKDKQDAPPAGLTDGQPVDIDLPLALRLANLYNRFQVLSSRCITENKPGSYLLRGIFVPFGNGLYLPGTGPYDWRGAHNFHQQGARGLKNLKKRDL